MKKFVYAFVLLIGLSAQAQIRILQPINGFGFQWENGAFKNTLHIPSFCGEPTLGDAYVQFSGVAVDTCGHVFYFYDGSSQTWRTISGSGGGGDGNPDTINVHYPLDTANGLIIHLDSLPKMDYNPLTRNTGTWSNQTLADKQYVDSVAAVGGGGSGNTNTNIGAFFRFAIPGTNQIKTIAAGNGWLLDSTSNTNAITGRVDTAKIASKFRADSLAAVVATKQNQLNGTGFVKASGTTITYDNSTYLTSIDTTNIPNFSTKVHSLFSATAPITYNSGTGGIAITQATTSTDGYLSSTDWNTFNNKGGSTTTADSTLIATGGQTAFTFSAVPGSYTDYIIFVNGASIEPVTYFTTSSNTITFSIGLVVGDRVRYKRIK